MAKIQLNGKKVLIKNKLSVLNLLKKHKLNEKNVAVEHNGKIISRQKYKNKIIKNNDKIEIVYFIGGG